MTIHLNPELEAFVRQDAASAGFASVDAYVAEVLTARHRGKVWLSEHRDEVRSAIEEGWTSAERGELMSGDHVKREMAAMKAQWFAEHKAWG